MDSQRFDNLARRLAQGTSRRQFLKGAAGAAIGGSLVTAGMLRALPAAAACANPGDSCSADSDCCQGSCSEQGACYCQDPDRPVLGCSCDTGTENPCGATTLQCCPSGDTPGGAGVCTSSSVSCNPTGQCANPGDSCSADSDCCQGSCSEQGACYCQDPDRPVLGCSCDTGTENPCGTTTLQCCATGNTPGGPGICTSASVGCNPTGQCVYAGDACTADSDCCEGKCSQDGVCYCEDPDRPALGCGCNSGTEDPCGDENLICCPSSNEPGAHGTCASKSTGCGAGPSPSPSSTTPANVLPNTGSGDGHHAGAVLPSAALIATGAAIAGHHLRKRRQAEDFADA